MGNRYKKAGPCAPLFLFCAMQAAQLPLKTIAIVAHDGKKAEMVAFIRDHRHFFGREDIRLIATGTTGSHVVKAGFQVEKMESGPVGGDAQIASRIVEQQVDMVLFFRDPMGKHPHEVDVSMLMRICDVHNVPLATNEAAARLMVAGATIPPPEH